MLRSMTGYGCGEGFISGRKVVTEVRSFNYRFLDVSVRISRNFFSLEREIKRLVASCTSRGKVDIVVQIESPQNDDLNIHISTARAKKIYGLLQQIKKEADIPGDINISSLLSFKDIIFKEEEENIDDANYWEAIKPLLDHALQAMKRMQDAEGEEIAKDIMRRMKGIEDLTGKIEMYVPEYVVARKQALEQRVRTLCEDIEVDEARILQEIAVLADRSDITEELVRAKSHVKQFLQWVDTAQEPAGRKLDFLIQEINREVNTIGAKASSSEISLMVVEIKNELEKIREQVQNVM